MKTVSIQLYTIDELEIDAAKGTARAWYRRCTDGDSSWADYTIEECALQGQLLGIEFKQRDVKLYGGGVRQEPCILWSGFSSQGDGACFEGTWRASNVKADEVADGWGDDPATTEIKRIAAGFGDLAARYPEASFTVTHRDRYCHERSVDYGFDWEDQIVVHGSEDSFDDAEEELQDLSRSYMRWIYQQLETEWQWQNSDECIDENMVANAYSFLGTGVRFDA